MAKDTKAVSDERAPDDGNPRKVVVPIPGQPPYKGGATLADRVRAIELKFGGDNPDDGLTARFKRQDLEDKERNRTGFVAMVEIVPAPEEVKEEVTRKALDGNEYIDTVVSHVFDVDAVNKFNIGDRITAHSTESFADAVAKLEAKLGIGGDQ